MSIEHKSRKEYLRERFEMFGAEGLMPRDAVELVLGYAMDGEKLSNAVDALFERYHGVKGIFSDSVEELQKAADLPTDALVLLQLMSHLGGLLSSQRAVDEAIHNVNAACEYFRYIYRGIRVEQFKAACLSPDGRVAQLLSVGSGSTFGVSISIGDVVKSVSRAGCARVILAHNHPGGSSNPSPEDVETTERLCRALENVGVTVIDHIIVGRDGVRSMFSGAVC